MDPFKKIRSLFHPIQPSVGPPHIDIIYQELEPAPEIQDYVYCYWQLKSVKRLATDFEYRVVTDGCIDVFFNVLEPSDSAVMGFCQKFTKFSLGQEFNYLGIRFLPAAFPTLYEVHAQRLSNQAQPLEPIVPPLAQWLSSDFRCQGDFSHLVSQLNSYLTDSLLGKTLKRDERFLNALNLIFEKHGQIGIETQLQTGLSPRQLRRIFNYYVGTTPKSFASVVRFQYLLKFQEVNDNRHKIYFDLGYYDQAHFIKDFKRFYGVTPSVAFG